MSTRLDRRRLLTSLSALAATALAGPALGRVPEVSLRPRARPTPEQMRADRVSNLLERMNFRGDLTCAAQTLRGPRALAQHQADQPLPPASTAKVLTAAYALDRLGPDHRFETRLIATGGIHEGTVLGDLILVGGGDPMLDTDALAAMLGDVQAQGITSVRGDFLYWEGALPSLRDIDPTQPAQVAYNPALSGLNLNFNRVIFEWARAQTGYDVTLQARALRHRTDVRLARMEIVPRSHPIYTYAEDAGIDHWTVAQGALGKGGARALPVRRPGHYTAEVFQTLAEAAGLPLATPRAIEALPAESFELARHRSAPLTEILRNMLRYSNNLIAELCGLAATATVTGDLPLDLRLSAAAMNAWGIERLGLKTPALVDHSGLSAESRICAGDMLQALVTLRAHPGFKELLHDYPMRDAQRRVLKDHPVSLNAKTGTLNFVSGLVGYATLPDGQEVAFAILGADLATRDKVADVQKENPPGGRAWAGTARRVQQALIDMWVASAQG